MTRKASQRAAKPQQRQPAAAKNSVAEPGPDPDLVAANLNLKRFEQDCKLLDARYEELVADHPHWWVAVYQGQFYLAPTYDEWSAKLDEAGVPYNRIVRAKLLPKGERMPIIPLHAAYHGNR